jgi:hypothetical protein
LNLRANTMVIRLACAILATIVLQTPAVGQTTAQKVQQAFDAAKLAAVKLRVSGMSPGGASRNLEGTGFFIYSDDKMSFLLSALHVVGSSETEQAKNPDWRVENGEPVRRIRLQSFDANGAIARTIEDVYVAPVYLPGVDIALLMVEVGGFKTLPLATNLIEKIDLHDVILLGVRAGATRLTRPIPFGQGSIVRFKYVTTVPSRLGESGGPWVDIASGKVFAVASAVRTSPDGPSVEATPVTFIKSALEGYFKVAGLQLPADAAPVQTASVTSSTASVQVAVAGDTGQLQAGSKKIAGLNEWASVQALGAEQSECDAGSGRTMSQALAQALVSKVESSGLRFEYRSAVQGGHYRKATACLGNNLIGLRGVDTKAWTSIKADGTMDLLVGDGPFAINWNAMPQSGAEFILMDSNGNTVTTKTISESGQTVFKPVRAGVYKLTTKITAEFTNAGAAGSSSALNATMNVQALPSSFCSASTNCQFIQ